MAQLNGGNGAIQWAHNLTSPALAGPTNFLGEAHGIATDAASSTDFIARAMRSARPGQTSLGALDVFVARYDFSGALLWVRQLGSSPPSNASGSSNLSEQAFGLARNSAGVLFVVGDTVGSWGTPNPNTDRTDWFVLKLWPSDGAAY